MKRVFDSQHLTSDPETLKAFDRAFGGSACNYHIFAVAQYPRATEDGPCEPVITPYPASDKGQHKHWRPKNPSSRRDGLVMLLGGEWGEWVELRVFQHKGYMFQELGPATFDVEPFPEVSRRG